MSNQSQHPSSIPVEELPRMASAWQAGIPFGEGFQRSFLLLRHHFRWLLPLYLFGGICASFALFPLDQIITHYAELLSLEISQGTLDLAIILRITMESMGWSLLREFILAFSIFLLSTIAVYITLQRNPSIRELSGLGESSPVSFVRVLSSGLLFAALLAGASLILAALPVVHVLLFFTPVLILLKGYSPLKAIRQSINLRYQHWQRLLGALTIIYLFTLFAGTLGVMISQNIQLLFTLAGISLGPARPLLLFIFTQLLVATIAPLLPMFSLVFFPGATLAYKTQLHQQAIKSRHRLVPSTPLIPLRDEGTLPSQLCPQCGEILKPNAHFCHHCGSPIRPPLEPNTPR